MCGIVGVHRLTDRVETKIDRLVGALLAGIESRGKDATGFAAITDEGKLTVEKAACGARHFNDHRRQVPRDARTVIGHTRFATQGDPAFMRNNHPVKSGPILVTHNGHVWNDRELFWAAPDIRRNAEVDSEAIALILRQHGWTDALGKLEEIDGDAAFAAINRDRPGELILARANTSPLVYVKTKHLLVWASTSEALERAWGTVLGTPPRIRTAPEGFALVVNGHTVEEREFPTGWTFRKTATQKWSSEDWRVLYGTEDDGACPITPRTPGTSLAIVRREGSSNGITYSGMVPVDDGTLARTYRVADGAAEPDDTGLLPGIDTLRCDDCQDWFDVSNLTTVKVMGDWANMLCPECLKWGRKTGIVAE